MKHNINGLWFFVGVLVGVFISLYCGTFIYRTIYERGLEKAVWKNVPGPYIYIVNSETGETKEYSLSRISQVGCIIRRSQKMIE